MPTDMIYIIQLVLFSLFKISNMRASDIKILTFLIEVFICNLIISF